MNRAEGITVVILSPVEWNFTWQSAQTIAKGLSARGYRVIFLNPLPKRLPSLKELSRIIGRLMNKPEIASYCRQPQGEGVQVLNPIALPDINEPFERLNRMFFLPPLVRKMRALINEDKLVVLSYLPFPLPLALVQRLKPDLLVYVCQTNWFADGKVKRSRLREKEMFRQADLVLADSPFLHEHASRHHPDVRRLPAMVDFDLFHRVALESPGAGLKDRIRCCYFGGVGQRIDVELLAKVSHKHLLRIIGPIRVRLPPLAPATELIKPVPHPELPRFLRDVDVFLLPYRVNEFTKAILPAKIFECFATGKPVVSTYLPSLLPYEGLVYLSHTHDDFLLNIERAVAEPPELREKRIAVARENTTDYWMDRLSRWIQVSLGGKVQ